MHPDLKAELLTTLQTHRSDLLGKLDGLSEYDLRRPLTPTATNLLGLVKHLAGLEYGYLGDALGRPAPETLRWIEDGSIWDGADMWAQPIESSAALIALYGRAAEHADRAVTELELNSPAEVAHWAPERRHTTLGVLLVRMVDETARHTGQADIIRELIDGRAGASEERDAAGWLAYHDQVETAARAFAS